MRDKELGNDQGILYLNRFRPHLVRAGFEVIDCPALTMRQKSAADIRIVIDVLGALESPVRYDEIIVASSDSDFTPLLLKLRANDRRTTIITAGTLAPAYQAVADTYIDEQQLIALLLPSIASTVDEPGDTHDGLESVAAPTTASPAGEPPQMDAPVSAASPTLEQPATTEAAHNTTLEAVQAPPTTAPATKAVNKATAAKKAASSAVPAKDSAALDNAKHRAHSKLSQLLADSDSPLNLATVASAIHTLVGRGDQRHQVVRREDLLRVRAVVQPEVSGLDAPRLGHVTTRWPRWHEGTKICRAGAPEADHRGVRCNRHGPHPQRRLGSDVRRPRRVRGYPHVRAHRGHHLEP